MHLNSLSPADGSNKAVVLVLLLVKLVVVVIKDNIHVQAATTR